MLAQLRPLLLPDPEMVSHVHSAAGALVLTHSVVLGLYGTQRARGRVDDPRILGKRVDTAVGRVAAQDLDVL
jgi:hypothetical protein